MTWHKINFNSQNIEHETVRAVLIKMPNKSDYAGYKFWHPATLVRGLAKGNGYFQSFSFTNDWEFTVFKTNKKGDKLDEIRLSPEDMFEAFDIVNEQITSDASDESFLVINEPVKVDKKVSVNSDLVR